MRGQEEPPERGGPDVDSIERLWRRVEALYRTGAHPAIQICLRHAGRVVLDRAIGYASGAAPADSPDTPRTPIALDTPINIFSASKSITAMLVHKLDERGALHLDDYVCEYVPEFASHGKQGITIRHVLAHRAGLPGLPVRKIDLDLLARPERVLELLCAARPRSRPGRLLAYHAVTGGFILAEVAERASGRSLRELLRSEIAEPLGLRTMNYGVAPEQVSDVAQTAFTGPPPPPPFSWLLQRAMGCSMRELVELSNDPRFLTAVVPSANVITTARELSLFYQCLLECLLDSGNANAVRLFEPRTVRHAIAEQSWWELDLTLFLPLRYGLGFMLGSRGVGPFGRDNPAAFGHLGATNVFSWADPDRRLAAAILTTGKPIVGLHLIPLFDILDRIGRLFGGRNASPERSAEAESGARSAKGGG